MNFPTSQKTGRSAELRLAALFLGWDWNAGQDHIDTGYDLSITPDLDRYRGVRFSVQVKGTAISGTTRPVAQVSRMRLRQYARDVPPVFIVRSTPEGVYYWIHAQAWTKENPKALIGPGKSQVQFDVSQTLDDKESFASYLDKVFLPLLERHNVLAIGDPDRVIDIKILSTPSSRPDTRPRLRQSQMSQNISGTLSFQPVRTEDNKKRMRNALGYGLPRSFEVEEFSLKSPAGSNLTPSSEVARGRMTVRQLPKSGIVGLCPGKRYAIISQDIAIPANLFSGPLGTGIINDALESSLDLELILTPDSKGLKLDLQLGIRSSTLCKKPLRDLRDLASLATWAEQVAFENSLQITLDFDGYSQALPAISPLDNIVELLQRLRSLSRLHMVARALSSDFVLPNEFQVTQSDLQDIDLAFELLKGERRAVNIGPMEVDQASETAKAFLGQPGQFLCTSNWEFTIADQNIGTIPIQIDLPRYEVQIVPDSEKMVITRGLGGEAWMSYSEHSDRGVQMRRAMD